MPRGTRLRRAVSVSAPPSNWVSRVTGDSVNYAAIHALDQTMIGAAIVRDLFRQYWPLLAIPPAAALIHGVLVVIGDPWSPAEWASNIVFAYVVTVATVVLSRRQGKLQQSSADNELLEKVAAVTGALDRLRGDCQASAAQQILVDARAGLHLLPYADADSRGEYLAAISEGVSVIDRLLRDSVRPYVWWTFTQRQSLSACARKLHDAVESHVKNPEDRKSPAVRLIYEVLPRLGAEPESSDQLPFAPFERSFRKGDVGQRVRPMLDWDLLRDLITADEATITIGRVWSIDWLENHDVFAVWYLNKENRFAEYHDENVRPIRLNDIGGSYDALPEHRRANVESMALWLERLVDGRLPTTEIVTLQVRPGRLLVLDGNHRVAAIARGSNSRRGPLPIDIIEHRVVANPDERLLPDLQLHHESPCA